MLEQRSLQRKRWHMCRWITLVPLFFVASEAGGYTARLLLAQNNGAIRNKFLAEYITLILAPNIAQAFLYGITSGLLRAAPLRKFFLTKRSWLLPTFFIVADLICLSIQAIGGAQEANNNSTTSNSKRKRAGTIVLTGLAAQLAFLALFLLIFLWVTAKLVVVSRKAATAHRRIVKLVVGVVAAVCLVTARNCYRVADFSQNLKKDHTALGAKEVYYFSGEQTCKLCCVLLLSLLTLLHGMLMRADCGPRYHGQRTLANVAVGLRIQNSAFSSHFAMFAWYISALSHYSIQDADQTRVAIKLLSAVQVTPYSCCSPASSLSCSISKSAARTKTLQRGATSLAKGHLSLRTQWQGLTAPAWSAPSPLQLQTTKCKGSNGIKRPWPLQAVSLQMACYYCCSTSGTGLGAVASSAASHLKCSETLLKVCKGRVGGVLGSVPLVWCLSKAQTCTHIGALGLVGKCETLLKVCKRAVSGVLGSPPVGVVLCPKPRLAPTLGHWM